MGFSDKVSSSKWVFVLNMSPSARAPCVEMCWSRRSRVRSRVLLLSATAMAMAPRSPMGGPLSSPSPSVVPDKKRSVSAARFCCSTLASAMAPPSPTGLPARGGVAGRLAARGWRISWGWSPCHGRLGLIVGGKAAIHTAQVDGPHR
eukprot:scaffold8005_cov118-Isochrysis_galbana.AAC.20